MRRGFYIIFLGFFCFVASAQVSTSGCTLSGGMSIYDACSGTDPANGYSTTTSGIGCTTGCNLTTYSVLGTMCNGSPFNGNCNNATSSGGHQVKFTNYTIPAGCTAAVTADFKTRTGCTNAGVDAGDSLLISGSGGTSSSPNPNASGGSANANVSLSFTQTGGTLNIRLRSNRSEEIATWTITLSGTCGTNCSGVLPIQLTDFTAEANEEAVLLKWNVATEKNVVYYQLEKSTDGISFTPFQIVPAISGNAGANNLSYFGKDFSPSKGLNYYRLANIDADGSTNYARTISLLWDIGVSDGLNIITTNENIEVTTAHITDGISVFDMAGRLVFEKNEKSVFFSFPKSLIPKGLYLVKTNSGFFEPKKLLIQ